MNRRAGDAFLLAAGGVVLAVITEFAPFLYPYPLRAPLDPTYAAAALAGDLVWVAAMVASFWRERQRPMWKLIFGYRIVAALGVLWVANTSLTWTLWQMTLGLGTIVFAHLVLAFPGGRLRARYDRVLIYGAFGILAVSRVGWALTWEPDTTGCFPRCQINPFVIWPNAALSWLFGPGVAALIPVLAAAVIVGVWRHWRTATPAVRRALVPVVFVAPIELALTAVRYLTAVDQRAWEVVGVAISTSPLAFVQAAIPAGFLVGIAATRLSRGAIADLAIQLGHGAPIGGLRDALAQALRDPTLALAFPAPDGEGFVDPEGGTIALPLAEAPDRRVARLERDGEVLAVLVYDPALEVEDPGRVEAVASVAGLALENERLAAQVRAQLKEVRASRSRIVEAADAERRRIERDLHDGAQQRLVALAMRLDRARQTTPHAEALIDATTVELLAAVAEVRDLARGLHPPLLAERGLAAAVDALAERAAVPVEARVTSAPLSEELAAAAYFLIAEALTNATRHARATRVVVDVTVTGSELVVTVNDDGQGGLDPARGSGLQGLRDRIEAAGGTLWVESAPGRGSTVRAQFPMDETP